MSIKTITTSKLRDNLADVLENTAGDNLCIITRRGRANRAIVDLDKLEDLLAASNPAYLKEIAQARAQATAGEVFTIDEVFGNL